MVRRASGTTRALQKEPPRSNIKYKYSLFVRRRMSRETKSKDLPGRSISLPIPAQASDLFKHKATNDVLLFLTGHRYDRFSVSEIATQTDHPAPSVRRAISVLVENDLVHETWRNNRKLIRINRERLSVPDDPILRIPQREFQQPVKNAVDKLTAEIPDTIGIVLYGSVARGDADRRSDIDLWVLTQLDRASAQRTANTVARALEDKRFHENRYGFDIDVESVQSIPVYTSDVREIVLSGIPVYRTGDFETVEKLLLEEGDANE